MSRVQGKHKKPLKKAGKPFGKQAAARISRLAQAVKKKWKWTLRRVRRYLKRAPRTGKVILAVCAVMAVVAAGALITVFLDLFRARSGYDGLRDDAVHARSGVPVTASTAGTFATAPENPGDWDGTDAVLDVDFEKLLAENPDTIAWLHVPGAEISYPVLHAADNDYYLNRAFDGSDSAAGSIYLECTNKPDFRDCNSLIYGHNMRDGSMFGYLQEAFSSKDAMSVSPYFYIYLPDGTVNRYGIFSFYETSEGSDTYSVFTADDAYDYYVYYARTLSLTAEVTADLETFTERKPIVTLSTCAGPAGTTKRFALHGILCDTAHL